MTVIKVESGRDGINGGRLKWWGECKTEHQRRIEDISVSCQILSRLVLHLHFPFLSQSSFPGETNRFDIFMRKQLPRGAASHWLSDCPHLASSLKRYHWKSGTYTATKAQVVLKYNFKRILTEAETHPPPAPPSWNAQSQNRCLFSGVLCLYAGLVWAFAKQLSLHLSQNPSLL